MKKLYILIALLLWGAAATAQQKLTLFGIAQKWQKQEYALAVEGKAEFPACVNAFTAVFNDNPMLHAFGARVSGSDEGGSVPVADFKLDAANGYAKISLKAKQPAAAEARLWTLPRGRQVFVVKMVNMEEDTLPRIFFFYVDALGSRLVPAPEPDGLVYGEIADFLISPSGNRIEVKMENQPSDYMELQESGRFVYLKYAQNAFACYVLDPDASGKTNIRATPGGEVIGTLGAKQTDDDGVYTLSVFKPTDGWWQILDKNIGGVAIKKEGWIHYSVLAMRTRNYGREMLPLRSSPSQKASSVAAIGEVEMVVRPMDISADGKWVKVKCDAGTGWIELEWLCGNPYSTCP
ncbi:MAG: hypothetical protein J5640_00840 [Bacteroidales bacterium]|nr:hypothetical protein [Bacteroidales bacterium]